MGENFLQTMNFPSTAVQGTLTSVYNLGCFFGALSTIWSGDILGRPRVIMLGSTVIAVGAVIQASSFSVAQMMVGRVVAGLGTGMNTATAGVWQAETSKMRSRGKLVIIQMANCITGFSISNWLTLGFSFAPGGVAWRFPLAFQICTSTHPVARLMLTLNSFHRSHLVPLSILARFAASSYSKGSIRRSV